MCRYALEASALKQGQSEDKLHHLLRQLPKVRESACAWTSETPLLRLSVSYWCVFIHTHTHLQDLPTLRDSWLQIKESFTLAQQYTEVRIIYLVPCLLVLKYSLTSSKVLTYLLTSTKVGTQIGMFRPIRMDHTNCLQVAIKSIQFNTCLQVLR
jgi:hypothetical protein